MNVLYCLATIPGDIQGGVAHIAISCREIYNRAVKVLTKFFYHSIASIMHTLVNHTLVNFIAKILLALDQFDSIHQRNVVA